jgi:hypothetical protein
MRNTFRFGFVAVAALGLASEQSAFGAFITFSVGGDNTPASIQGTVDAFRTALGDPNNGNSSGPLADGRREINWDGGGATTASPAPTPFVGFQNNRGALFITPGTGFLQSPLDATELTSLNPTYSTTFSFFSGLRIFTPIESSITDVTFFVPGSGGLVPATVDGFGAVFSDVDLATAALLQFFDPQGNEILSAGPPPGTISDGSLSFLGAVAGAGEDIFRVRITTGTGALGPTDAPASGVDMVVLDDFIFAEPAAVPESGSALLNLCLGIAGITLVRYLRSDGPLGSTK